MIIGGVDPGKATGLAVMGPGRPISVVTLDGRKLPQVVSYVQQIARLGQEEGCGSVLVIENQFAGLYPKGAGSSGSTINLKAIATLFRRRHEWEIIAEVYGVPTIAVYPSTWQTVLRSVPRYHSDGSLRSTKARAILLASQLWPRAPVNWTPDKADAALIAEWYRRSKLLEDAKL